MPTGSSPRCASSSAGTTKKSSLSRRRNILVLDVGGSHVKCLATGRKKHVEFESGPKMTPDQMMKRVRKITTGGRCDVPSMCYCGAGRRGAPAREPQNLR